MGAGDLRDRYQRQRLQLVDVVRDQGIEDMDVLRAVAEVPRHRFVPESVRHRAYEDRALPIGFGQTISQPSLQALYLDTLRLAPSDAVLEVGTGSGYQTALIAELVERVYSIERVRELAERARATLDELGYGNIAIMTGDGSVGWSRYAPYDAILVAAASPSVPQALVDQLAPGGKLLVPVGDRVMQDLMLVHKRESGELEERTITQCVFVPLVGRYGWRES